MSLPFIFKEFGPMSYGNPSLPWQNVPHVDSVLEHIIKHSRQGEASIKILWTSPSAPWITCSTVLCVTVTWAVACCRCLPSTHSHRQCSPESCWVCKFWCHIFYVSLEYFAKKLLFLCTTWSLCPQKDALLDCTFHKSCSECQKSEVCRSLGGHSSL